MTEIDPTARIGAGAILGQRVSIGPYCVVGPDVILGDDCRLVANVHVAGHTRIGSGTVVHPFASLGGPPQSIAYRGELTRLEIGADCTIRESVTMSLGTAGGGSVTRVGDRGYFMSYSHVAHDCQVGNDAIFANCATLAGHCIVGDHVLISGLVAVHQFSRIGSGAMVAGGANIRGDVIPFGMAAGADGRLNGLNIVGMRRRNYSAQSIRTARLAFRKLFYGAGSLPERTDAVESEFGGEVVVAEIVAFLRVPRQRPLCQPRRLPIGGAVKETVD